MTSILGVWGVNTLILRDRKDLLSVSCAGILENRSSLQADLNILPASVIIASLRYPKSLLRKQLESDFYASEVVTCTFQVMSQYRSNL